MYKISIANTLSQSAKPKCIPKPGNELKKLVQIVPHYHAFVGFWCMTMVHNVDFRLGCLPYDKNTSKKS